MKEDFDEGLEGGQPLTRSTPAITDFDWEALYRRLNEDAAETENDPRLVEAIVRLLQMLVPHAPSRRSGPSQSDCGSSLWPGCSIPPTSTGSPSLRQLARRCGVSRRDAGRATPATTAA